MTIPFNLSKFANYLNASGNANPFAASDQANTSTGSLGLPYGTTAQRPSSPVDGYIRINTTTNVIEVYYNSTWNTFYTFVSAPPTVEYLVVAGGGGGGSYYGSGGGGGATAGAVSSAATSSATANTGSGSGGSGNLGVGGGGSGIVIIRYADTFPAATSTTGSPTITVAGGYRVYKWTSSGSITF